MKVSRAFLSCTSSPEEIMLADEAPRTASMAALSSDFAALYSAFPASWALAKVFCPASCAKPIPANKTSDASHSAVLMNFDCHRIHAPFEFLSDMIRNLQPYIGNFDAREVNRPLRLAFAAPTTASRRCSPLLSAFCPTAVALLSTSALRPRLPAPSLSAEGTLFGAGCGLLSITAVVSRCGGWPIGGIGAVVVIACVVVSVPAINVVLALSGINRY